MSSYLGYPSSGSNIHWVWSGLDWVLLPYGAGGSATSVFTDGGNKAKTTGSISIDSSNRYADALGGDVFFFVSGTIGLSGAGSRRSVFGGDLYLSGGLSGSLQRTATDISYLVAGSNITILTQSNGQILISSTGASSGSSLPKQDNITVVAGNLIVDQIVFQAVGCFEFNPTGADTMAPPASTTYTAYFQPIVEVSLPGMTTEVQLYNVGLNSYVTSSLLSTSQQLPTRLKSPDLSSQLATGTNIYEMHMRVTAPTTGKAICKGAKLFVTWNL
jgi:hypothetical protein